MQYTNSALAVCKKLSQNMYTGRDKNVDRITPHCVVGQCTAESLGNLFADPSRQASSNYGIDKDGRIGLYVEEKNTSWCSSSYANDSRAVTIECASDTFEPYRMNECVFESLVKLCTDICQRYGKTKLIWFGNATQSLAYVPHSNEMVITVHRWFANKSCPGDWLYNRLGELAERVTKTLSGTSEQPKKEPEKPTGIIYRIRKSWSDSKHQIGAFSILQNAILACPDGYNVYDPDGNQVYPDVKVVANPSEYKVKIEVDDLNIRTGAGTEYTAVGFIPRGVYTIVEEKSGKLRNGSVTKWGRLKSGAGWICLDYVARM